MRRTTGLILLLVAALVSLVPTTAPGAGGRSAAQGEAEYESITVETLVHGFPGNAPGRGLLLERITQEPGAELPTHTHPGTYAVFVESGEFSVTVVEGFAEVLWTGQATRQMVGPGEQVVLRAGDSLLEQRTLVHSGVNPGTAPVVLLAASLLTPGAPRLQSSDEPATPEPSWRPGQRP